MKNVINYLPSSAKLVEMSPGLLTVVTVAKSHRHSAYNRGKTTFGSFWGDLV